MWGCPQGCQDGNGRWFASSTLERKALLMADFRSPWSHQGFAPQGSCSSGGPEQAVVTTASSSTPIAGATVPFPGDTCGLGFKPQGGMETHVPCVGKGAFGPQAWRGRGGTSPEAAPGRRWLLPSGGRSRCRGGRGGREQQSAKVTSSGEVKHIPLPENHLPGKYLHREVIPQPSCVC